MGMKVLHNPVHLHYLDEGNACVNWVEYYIVNVSIGYCIIVHALIDEGIEKRN